MVVGCWRPPGGQTPGHFNTGWTQLVPASPCSVILDLTPSPLLFSRVPSFRAESAATGQLVIQCAAAGTHRGLLTVTKFASCSWEDRKETPIPRSSPKGKGAGPATCCVWHFVPLPFGPQHTVVPEGKACGPVSDGIGTQSGKSVLSLSSL